MKVSPKIAGEVVLEIRQHFTLLKDIYSEDELASDYYYQLVIL